MTNTAPRPAGNGDFPETASPATADPMPASGNFKRAILINWLLSLLVSLFFLVKNLQGVGGHLLMTRPEILTYIKVALTKLAVWKDLLQFFFGWLALHLGWAALATWILWSLQPKAIGRWPQRILLHGGFLILTLWLLIINSFLYPLSLTAVFKNTVLALPHTVVAFSIIFSFLLIIAAIRESRRHPYKTAVVIFLIAALLVGLRLFHPAPPHSVALADEAQRDRPNIIIIGIDALRPDHLGINGFKPSVTPYLDQLLSSSLIFDNAYTPLARTYGAWVSILTGQYPLHHGARFNLMPPDKVDRQHTLAHLLKKYGYRTVYAIDERRFNNIDESYGFDEIIGPKAGAADFLLTPFVDDPLINLISPSPFARILFPFVYGNRAHHKIYDPFLFTRDIAEAADRAHGQPLFLSVHFTLPHWPFVNNAMPSVPSHLDVLDEENPTHYFYVSMLKLADAQLEDLMDHLKHSGVLDNAIVFLLSDHGEGFMGDIDAPKSAIPQAHFTTNEAGHGTNVLTIKQYQVLLAYRRFGGDSPQGRSKRPSSLIDIAPTVLDIVGLSHAEEPFDGLSLFRDTPPHRPLFFESSINPQAISKKRLDAVKAIAEGIAFYTIDDNGRMIVRPKILDSVTAAKQRALVMDDWELALFPDMKDNFIVADLKKNLWWPSHFAPDQDRVHKMLAKLCHFYRNDTGFDPNGFCKTL